MSLKAHKISNITTTTTNIINITSIRNDTAQKLGIITAMIINAISNITKVASIGNNIKVK